MSKNDECTEQRKATQSGKAATTSHVQKNTTWSFNRNSKSQRAWKDVFQVSKDRSHQCQPSNPGKRPIEI